MACVVLTKAVADGSLESLCESLKAMRQQGMAIGALAPRRLSKGSDLWLSGTEAMQAARSAVRTEVERALHSGQLDQVLEEVLGGLCKDAEGVAATKLQAMQRGKISRIQTAQRQAEKKQATAEQAAATKVQALQRGKLARNRVNNMREVESSAIAAGDQIEELRDRIGGAIEDALDNGVLERLLGGPDDESDNASPELPYHQASTAIDSIAEEAARMRQPGTMFILEAIRCRESQRDAHKQRIEETQQRISALEQQALKLEAQLLSTQVDAVRLAEEMEKREQMMTTIAGASGTQLQLDRSPQELVDASGKQEAWRREGSKWQAEGSNAWRERGPSHDPEISVA